MADYCQFPLKNDEFLLKMADYIAIWDNDGAEVSGGGGVGWLSAVR